MQSEHVASSFLTPSYTLPLGSLHFSQSGGNLAVLPSNAFTKAGGAGTANTQSWLLSTLTRDTQAISNERKSIRGGSPSLGASSGGSMSDLHKASPADKNRIVIQPKESTGIVGGVNGAIGGRPIEAKSSASIRRGSDGRSFISVGGNSGLVGNMASTLPRVGSSGADLGGLK